MPSIRFTWSDAWLLLSIIHGAQGNRGAGLKDVIAMGDAINKAIFTPQELRRGLAKLTKAGYVTETAARYFSTDLAMHKYKPVSQRRVLDQLEGLKVAIGAGSYSPGEDPCREDPEWPYPQLTDETIAAADAEYRVEFAEILRQLEEKDAGA